MLLRFSFLDNSQDFRNFTYFVECTVDAYIVVLRNLAGRGLVCSYNLTSVLGVVKEFLLLVVSSFCWQLLLYYLISFVLFFFFAYVYISSW
jgi:hypothetical protein